MNWNQPRREILSSQAKKRRCAQCYGPVVMKRIDEEWMLVCPKGCKPGGHVSVEFVEQKQREDSIDAFKVGQNYPELDPNKLTEEEIENGKKALWD